MISNTQLDTAKIQKQLQKLSKELQVKAVKAGVAKVSGSGIKLMKLGVPTEKGEVKKSIRRRLISKSGKSRLGFKPEQIVQFAGPILEVSKEYGGWIGNILEGGAKAHKITPRGESEVHKFLKAQGLSTIKASNVLASGSAVFGKTVNHPGIKASRFVRKADQVNSSRAQGLFYQGVNDFLKRKKLL